MPCASSHRLINAVTTFSYLAFREPQPGERHLPHPAVGAAGTALLATIDADDYQEFKTAWHIADAFNLAFLISVFSVPCALWLLVLV